MLFLQVPQWRDGDLWISDPCILLDPKQNLRNLILEVLFLLRPTILAAKRNWMRGFLRPSIMIFLRFRLRIQLLNWIESQLHHFLQNAPGVRSTKHRFQ